MNLLALETATEACSVALLCGEDSVQRHVIAPRGHTDLVLSMIDAVLAEAGLARGQLDAVAFGHGPGSFTGVRIACALAQGIACARDLPVIGVSSLQALARGAAREHRATRLLVATDARRQEIYYAAYTFDAAFAVSTCLIADTLMQPEAVIVPASGAWLATGNGWRIYAQRFAGEVRTLPRAEGEFPQACDVGALALVELAAGRGVSAERARPIYLRGAVD